VNFHRTLNSGHGKSISTYRNLGDFCLEIRSRKRQHNPVLSEGKYSRHVSRGITFRCKFGEIFGQCVQMGMDRELYVTIPHVFTLELPNHYPI